MLCLLFLGWSGLPNCSLARDEPPESHDVAWIVQQVLSLISISIHLKAESTHTDIHSDTQTSQTLVKNLSSHHLLRPNLL